MENLSRYSRHNHINNNQKLVISDLRGTGAALAVKSRREKRRRLSLLVRSGTGGACEDEQGTEMGSSKSNGQDDELHSSTVSTKKLKLHKKIHQIYEDCNAVDRASIPRKLRSVSKKGTCHTISESLPYPKNVNGFLKKPKSGVRFNPEHMSKDEREVAEALYALAGMVPHKVTSLVNKSDDESPSEKQMHSKNSSQGPQASDEVGEDTCNQISEELSGQINGIMQVDELGKSAPFSQPKLSQTKVNLNASLNNHQSLTKFSLCTKKNDIEGREVLPSQRHSEKNYGVRQTRDLVSQDKDQHASTGGSISFPSLHFQPSHGSGAHDGFHSQYYATKIPHWLHTAASSSEPALHESKVSHNNEIKAEKCRKRIKIRSPSHVYISHYIQSSQKPQGKEVPLLETIQLKTSEGANLRDLQTSCHPTPVLSESAKMVPDSDTITSFPGKNTPEASNDTVMALGRCSRGQEQPESGNSTSTKRCYDFLSLSTGDRGTEPRLEGNRKRIPLAGLPVSQLQAITRYDPASAFPLPTNLIQSNTYQNMRSTSNKLPIPQLHPYFSRTNRQDSNTTSITKQQQQQKLQPPMWMTEPSSQLNMSGSGTMGPPQIAYWQSSSQEPKTVEYTNAQVQPFPQSSLSSGGHFPKYIQIPSQQNHQMLRISTPFPAIQVNGQHSPVPIWGDKSGS